MPLPAIAGNSLSDPYAMNVLQPRMHTGAMYPAMDGALRARQSEMIDQMLEQGSTSTTSSAKRRRRKRDKVMPLGAKPQGTWTVDDFYPERRSGKVGEYYIFDTIGEGSSAKVKRALNVRTGRRVAIKIMHKKHVHSHQGYAQAQQEITAMKELKHDFIVGLEEVLSSETKLYIVMEEVTGGELYKLLNKGPLSEHCARRYFQQMMEAVGYCHDRNVIHRDLKPENVMVDEHDRIKITDFGFSKLHEGSVYNSPLHTNCGTPEYCSPEIIQSAAQGYIGTKVDIWSSGIILYAMLTGQLPFQSQSDPEDPNHMSELYHKIITCDYEFPSDVPISMTARDLIKKILVPNPDVRLSIEQIKAHPWVRTGYQEAVARRKPAGSLLEEVEAASSRALSLETASLNAESIRSLKMKFQSHVSLTSDIPRRNHGSGQSINSQSDIPQPADQHGSTETEATDSNNSHGSLFKHAGPACEGADSWTDCGSSIARDPVDVEGLMNSHIEPQQTVKKAEQNDQSSMASFDLPSSANTSVMTDPIDRRPEYDVNRMRTKDMQRGPGNVARPSILSRVGVQQKLRTTSDLGARHTRRMLARRNHRFINQKHGTPLSTVTRTTQSPTYSARGPTSSSMSAQKDDVSRLSSPPSPTGYVEPSDESSSPPSITPPTAAAQDSVPNSTDFVDDKENAVDVRRDANRMQEYLIFWKSISADSEDEHSLARLHSMQNEILFKMNRMNSHEFGQVLERFSNLRNQEVQREEGEVQENNVDSTLANVNIDTGSDRELVPVNRRCVSLGATGTTFADRRTTDIGDASGDLVFGTEGDSQGIQSRQMSDMLAQYIQLVNSSQTGEGRPNSETVAENLRRMRQMIVRRQGGEREDPTTLTEDLEGLIAQHAVIQREEEQLHQRQASTIGNVNVPVDQGGAMEPETFCSVEGGNVMRSDQVTRMSSLARTRMESGKIDTFTVSRLAWYDRATLVLRAIRNKKRKEDVARFTTKIALEDIGVLLARIFQSELNGSFDMHKSNLRKYRCVVPVQGRSADMKLVVELRDESERDVTLIQIRRSRSCNEDIPSREFFKITKKVNRSFLERTRSARRNRAQRSSELRRTR